MEIMVLLIRVLKLFFLLPYKTFSRALHLALALGLNTFASIDSSFTFTAAIYQFQVGIEEPNVVVDSLIGVGNTFGYWFILGCFLWQTEKITTTIKDIDIFLKYCTPEVIFEAEEKVNFYTKVFLAYFCGGLFFNGLCPFLDRKNCNEQRLSDFYRQHDPCMLPIRKMYPFDASEVHTFPFVFIAETITDIVICFVILLTTLTLIGLLMHITAQIENCRKEISAIFDRDPKDSDVEAFFKMRQRAEFCVSYHIDIINYTNRVFDIFNMMLIVHISLTSMIFGIIGYQIVKVENLNDKIRYTMQMAGWMAMLFITCFFGQRIIDESKTIADIAYACNWHSGPVNLQKTIGIMILRGQKPLTLKAASLGTISLETFLAVLKTAYSYFALLLTISD